MKIFPNSALIVVDLQNDFLPGGSLGVDKGNEIVEPILDLIDDNDWKLVVATRDHHPSNHTSFASSRGKPVYSTVVDKDPTGISGLEKTQILWPDHCVQGTSGSELQQDFKKKFEKLKSENPEKFVEVLKGELRDREYYSAFEDIWGHHRTELALTLQNHAIDYVYLVGLAYDFCVLNTGLSSVKFGFKTKVLRTMCRSVYPDKIAETEKAYKEGGIEIVD